MNNFFDDLTDLCETLADELEKTNEKLRKAGGELSAGDLEYVDKLTHALKSVKTIKAMEQSYYDNYSGDYKNPYYGSNNMDRMRSYEKSYTNGRGRYARRDSMGRYSGDTSSIISELREIMENAPDDRTRDEFKRFISKIEAM